MAYNSSTHTITAIVYDNPTGLSSGSSVNAEGEVTSGPNGWTVNTINLAAKTWTTAYYTETLGATSAITAGATGTPTFDAIKVAVFVQNELEAQELSIAGENYNA